ncbi:MAG: dihydropteroate synthase, partial [Bacteroidota bacterium]
ICSLLQHGFHLRHDAAPRMVADFIDVGGMSSRPGAVSISEKEEKKRVLPVIEMILTDFPDTLISVDTFRAGVARAAVEAGAVLVNDISAGKLDAKLFETVADLGVPYILMHMKGVPATMQQNPQYESLLAEVMDFFIEKVGRLRALGVRDIVLDVGFGFGKSLEDNYTLLQNMHAFRVLELPLLAGISRKSMIYKLLKISPDEALNGTSALHMVALQQGAKILRVHDVAAARECIALWQMLEQQKEQ